MDSPRFPETSARAPSNSPRFTEHINGSPTYMPYSTFAPEDSTPHHDVESHYRARLSSKEEGSFATVMSPGLESVKADEGDKEVAPGLAEPVPQTWQYRDDNGRRQGRTVCRVPLFWFCILVAAIIVTAIALGVGLGVGLGDDSSSSPPPPPLQNTSEPLEPPINSQNLIGGAIDPAFYSNTGAFNGSGIALASQSFAGEGEDVTHGSLVMYYQHHTGDIRYVQLSSEGEWLGGSSSEVVATNAKNNTPLSAVSYSVNGENSWHLFYIDQDDTLRQRSNSNATNLWVDGDINDQNLTVWHADQVGMQACWYGNDYGDSDYVHTPLPGGVSGSDSGKEAANNGMHMWFASDEKTFQQYGWRYGDTEWLHQETWTNKNGHAGVACYSWIPDSSTTYAMFVNTEDTVEIWWRDTSLNHTNSTDHPINEWTNTSVALNGAHPSTSLGFTNYLYWQDAATNMIMGQNVSWAAENTTLVGDPFTVDGAPGIPGTHLSVSALPNAGGGNTLTVFFQVEGDDVTEYTRDLEAGQWTTADIPIEAA